MTFAGIRGGDRVVFTDARGNVRAGIASPLLLFPAHVVVNTGGQHGTPAVVNASNYLRHSPRRQARPVMRAGG